MPDPRSPAADALRAFLDAFGAGDLDAVAALFTDAAEVVADGPADAVPFYGTHRGPEGARAFVRAVLDGVDVEAFALDTVVGDGHTALAAGSFTDRVRSTGRRFTSAFMMRADTVDGPDGPRIRRLLNVEDKAAARDAWTPR